MLKVQSACCNEQDSAPNAGGAMGMLVDIIANSAQPPGGREQERELCAAVTLRRHLAWLSRQMGPTAMCYLLYAKVRLLPKRQHACDV